jgi:hypothetical protein
MAVVTDPQGEVVVAVRSAAIAFLTTKDEHHVHPECIILEVTTNGKLVLREKDYCECNEQEQEFSCTPTKAVIHNTWILPTTAVVEYEKVSSGFASSSAFVGYVTLLLHQKARNNTTSQQQQPHQKWVVISVVMTTKSTTPVTSLDLQGPIEACWDQYCSANRACDGAAMAQVFHPYCRLTYASSATAIRNSSFSEREQETGLEVLQVHVKSCAEFLSMVSHRYETEPHIAYAAYHRNEPEKVAACDTLQGISMAAPTLGVVRLKVGHPPFLWSDFLVCAKIQNDDDNSSTRAANSNSWWIVSKSSSSEPFMVGRPDGAA